MRALLLALAALAPLSLGLAAKAGEVLLTVSRGDAPPALYTMDDLKALPMKSFTTSTIWTEGEVDFMGVQLVDFLAHLGVKDGALSAQAINDYAVKVPVADAVENGPMIAYEMNGEAMSPRDKGPLWIVYPFDADETYQTETYYSRSIWQLDRITVIE